MVTTGSEARSSNAIELDRITATRLVARDEDALRELFDRNAASLLATAQRVGRDRAEAEDVVQELFVGLWRRPHSYDPDRGSLAGWLHMRCRGVALDRLRSQAARRRRECFASAGIREHHDDSHNKVDELLADAGALRSALAGLTDHERRLIGLTYFGGLTYAAAAVVLDIPVGTAKSQIRCVLTLLRRQLSPRSFD
jgi:RNA polymerase sigma-70 factor (ECF subfamily)